jgi:PPM family protein phosphatase
MRRTAPSAVRRVAPLNAAIATDVGTVREENQDRVAVMRGSDRNGTTFVLAVLADGIGGMKRGAECASITLGTFIDSVVTGAQQSHAPRDWLLSALVQANRAVYARHAGDGGSTLAAILMAKGNPPLWLSIGDSRVFHATDAKLIQLSRDDTLEGQLGKPIEGGRRSELLQFVGIGENLEPHIEASPSIQIGTMLLTSDGVHFIEPTYLAKVLQFAPDLGVCVRRLTDLAKMLGAPDNASVAALSLDAPKADPDAHLDSSFEVWDPFGELQVFFDRGARRYPSKAPTPSREAHRAEAPAADAKRPEWQAERKESSEQKLADAALGNEAGNAKDQKKAKGGRKSRATGAKVEGEPGEQGEVPQLLIEFPHKAS